MSTEISPYLDRAQVDAVVWYLVSWSITYNNDTIKAIVKWDFIQYAEPCITAALSNAL